MNKSTLTWTRHGALHPTSNQSVSDKTLLRCMDASAAGEELFVTLSPEDPFPFKQGDVFEDWQIRIAKYGSERFVRLIPTSNRTREIVIRRKMKWLRDNFDYDESFIETYARTVLLTPRAWILDVVRMTYDFQEYTSRLKLVVGDGRYIKKKLKEVSVPYPVHTEPRDILAAIRIVERLSDVSIFTES